MKQSAASGLLNAFRALSIASPAAARPAVQSTPLLSSRIAALSPFTPRVRQFSATAIRAGSWLEPNIDRKKKKMKGRPRVATGGSTKGTTVVWGEYGLRMKDHHRRISAQQLKCAEDTIKLRLRGNRAKCHLPHRVQAQLYAKLGIDCTQGMKRHIFAQPERPPCHDIAGVQPRVEAVQGGDETGKITVIYRPEMRIQAAIVFRISSMEIEDAAGKCVAKGLPENASPKHDDEIRLLVLQRSQGGIIIHGGDLVRRHKIGKAGFAAIKPMPCFVNFAFGFESVARLERRRGCSGSLAKGNCLARTSHFAREIGVMQRLGGEYRCFQDGSRSVRLMASP